MTAGLVRTDLSLARRILRELRPWRVHVAGVFALSLLATPLALLTPLSLKIAVDSVLGPHPVPGFIAILVPEALAGSKGGLLVFTAIFFLAVALLTQIQDLATTVLKTYTGEQLLLSVRTKLFERAQRLSLTYHDQTGTADSSYRIQEDAKAFQYIAVDTLVSLITAVATLVAMVYVTARINLQLAFVSMAVAPLLLIAARHFRIRLRRQARQVKRLESGAMSVVQEVLTGLRVVKAFAQEDREQGRFHGRARQGTGARLQLAISQGAYAVLVGSVIGLGGALILYIGVRSVQRGAMTLGDLILVMGYLSQLYQPLKTMAKKAGTLQAHLASAERVFALLDEPLEAPERPNARPLRRARGAVEFRGVSFAYEPDRPVVHDVSFAVEPGTTVGIAGVTGAGKSTLMGLLTRFYDPVAGEIVLDGVDLRDFRLADLRRQFGIVLQEPVLFSTSIGENIAYGGPGARGEEIEAAAKAANVHDFIAGLPEGYDTEVGERGVRLSGGERQRISLARAFLKDAAILILDEPTSSVDTRTEAEIIDAMQRLMADRTSFMIAHRLSTLEICDARIEVEGGRVVTPADPRNGGTVVTAAAQGQPDFRG
ncbi:MAG: ABC transporter ATP-binding protein/permease [Actinomycetota bacterium]|nr:ABC transporter ATP-binding protein/permease [Actinomycetota bacterium]